MYVDSQSFNETQEIEKVEVLSTTGDIMLTFQVTFKEPYLYALLNKKVDRLYCYRKMVADQSLVHYNATAFTLGNNYSVR